MEKILILKSTKHLRSQQITQFREIILSFHAAILPFQQVLK